jgi:hypothetical protein
MAPLTKRRPTLPASPDCHAGSIHAPTRWIRPLGGGREDVAEATGAAEEKEAKEGEGGDGVVLPWWGEDFPFLDSYALGWEPGVLRELGACVAKLVATTGRSAAIEALG